MRRDLDALAAQDFDLLVIGGGITGAGAALDAALRGLRVALIDKGDFASGTSSVSSKLIHGGLRYLEHGDFFLVYEALHERRRLLRNAPHLVRPLRFVLPFYAGARVPPWEQRLGLLLYDLLAGAANPPQPGVSSGAAASRLSRPAKAGVVGRRRVLRRPDGRRPPVHRGGAHGGVARRRRGELRRGDGLREGGRPGAWRAGAGPAGRPRTAHPRPGRRSTRPGRGATRCVGWRATPPARRCGQRKASTRGPRTRVDGGVSAAAPRRRPRLLRDPVAGQDPDRDHRHRLRRPARPNRGDAGRRGLPAPGAQSLFRSALISQRPAEQLRGAAAAGAGAAGRAVGAVA